MWVVSGLRWSVQGYWFPGVCGENMAWVRLHLVDETSNTQRRSSRLVPPAVSRPERVMRTSRLISIRLDRREQRGDR